MIEKIKSLCNKYKDQGLDIWIEFTEFKIIFRAYWYNKEGELLTFRRSYLYCSSKDLEVLVDRFANETLQYKRSGLI